MLGMRTAGGKTRRTGDELAKAVANVQKAYDKSGCLTATKKLPSSENGSPVDS